jgi:hypothetical protein
VFDDNLKTDVEEQSDLSNTVLAAGASRAGHEQFLGENQRDSPDSISIPSSCSSTLGDDPIGVSARLGDISARPLRCERLGDMQRDSLAYSRRRHLLREFMRIFDHLYSRYIVGKMKKLGSSDPSRLS